MSVLESPPLAGAACRTSRVIPEIRRQPLNRPAGGEGSNAPRTTYLSPLVCLTCGESWWGSMHKPEYVKWAQEKWAEKHGGHLATKVKTEGETANLEYERQ